MAINNDRIGSRPFFERGIESIVVRGDTPQLPDTHDIAPPDLAYETALDALLHAENLESMLDSSVRPSLAARELLAPGQFRAALEDVRKLLRRHAELRKRANMRSAKVLERAGEIVDDEIELRDLLWTCLNALHEG
jgi:hypothetical protein